MIRTVRRLAAAGALTLSFAILAPLTALACSGGSAAVTGGGSGPSGGGLGNPFDSIGGPAVIYASAGFLFLLAIGLVAIALAVAIRPRRQPVTLISPDGRYWWDGSAWRPVPTV